MKFLRLFRKQSIKNKDGFYKLAERQGLFSSDFLRQETTDLNQYLNINRKYGL